MPHKPEQDSAGLPVIDFDQHALFFDVDGTLLDIAAAPDAVMVPDALHRALDSLAVRLSGALALVTGRGIGFVEERFSSYRGPVAALHGAEFRHASGAVERIEPDARFADARDFLRAASLRSSGLIAEDKGAAIALHYRAAPEKAAFAREMAEKALRLAGPGWIIQPGKMVFELRPAGGGKDAALRRFMRNPPFAGRIPVAFGDDLTDLPMLEAARESGGAAVAVGTAVLRAGMASVADPEELRAWLYRLAEIQEERN